MKDFGLSPIRVAYALRYTHPSTTVCLVIIFPISSGYVTYVKLAIYYFKMAATRMIVIWCARFRDAIIA